MSFYYRFFSINVDNPPSNVSLLMKRIDLKEHLHQKVARLGSLASLNTASL